MAKQTAKQSQVAHRAAKKARVDAVSVKETKFRVKGSPRPQAKTTKIPAVPSESIEPPVKSKGKGKQKQNDVQETIPERLPSTFKLIAGSYEKLLYGLEGATSLDGEKVKFHLKPIFIFPAHVSCIKSVAASPEGGKWLATGSADEIVKVWDLRRRKEIGGLMHHEGSITHLTFPSRSHLVSASEDGTLCIFHARDWSVLRTLRGHKGRVNSVSVHPSGKVALSVGKDRTLRMWDMMRGIGRASTKLGKEGEIVRWSTDGKMFAVQSGKEIDVYKTDMTLVHSITHPSRLHDIHFCKRVNASDAADSEVLFAGAEDKKLSVYEISLDPERTPRAVAEMVGHENRIKAIETMRIALPSASASASSTTSTSPRTSTTIVCTVSSDGKIHVYDLGDLPPSSSSISSSTEGDAQTKEGVHQILPVVSYDSKGTRLTCIALAEGDVAGDIDADDKENKKRKRNDDEGVEEGDYDDEEAAGDQDEEAEDGVEGEDGFEDEEEEMEGEEEEEEEEEEESE